MSLRGAKLTYVGCMNTIRSVLYRPNFVFYKMAISDRNETRRISGAKMLELLFTKESSICPS